MTIILTGSDPVASMYAGQSRLINATHLSFSGITSMKRISRFRKGGNREEQREVKKHVAAGGSRNQGGSDAEEHSQEIVGIETEGAPGGLEEIACPPDDHEIKDDPDRTEGVWDEDPARRASQTCPWRMASRLRTSAETYFGSRLRRGMKTSAFSADYSSESSAGSQNGKDG